MLIPLGILDFPVAAGSYDLLETEILASNTASVTFDVTGLGSTYQHLQLRMVVTNSVDTQDLQLICNADTGSNYASHWLAGNGSTVGSGKFSDTTQIRLLGNYQGIQDDIPTPFIVDILDPFETTKNTTTRNFCGHTNAEIALTSGVYLSTSAITSLKIQPSSGNLVTGSRFSLYGLKGA